MRVDDLSKGARGCKSGFTLLEILVVVMIITILASIVGIKVAQEPGKAKRAAAEVQMGVFRTALSLYRMDNDTVPSQQQGLRALCEKPSIEPIPPNYRQGGYLESRTVPPDPWGEAYAYLAPGRKGEAYEIVSYGSDRQPGGDGLAADLSSSASP